MEEMQEEKMTRDIDDFTEETIGRVRMLEGIKPICTKYSCTERGKFNRCYSDIYIFCNQYEGRNKDGKRIELNKSNELEHLTKKPTPEQGDMDFLDELGR